LINVKESDIEKARALFPEAKKINPMASDFPDFFYRDGIILRTY
jgi:hypothetical protein